MINTSSLKCLGLVIPFNHAVVENGYLLIPSTRQSPIANPWHISNMADRQNYKPEKKGIPSNIYYEVGQTSLTDCYVVSPNIG